MPDTTFTSTGQIAILATALVTLLTTLATLVYQFVREGRRHRWEEEAARAAAEIAAKSERERVEIKQRVEQAETTLHAKIDENTVISRQAFNEANHVNEKLAIQAAAFDKLLNVALSASEKRSAGAATARGVSENLRNVAAAKDLKEVKDTVDATAGQVADIHQKVVENGDHA